MGHVRIKILVELFYVKTENNVKNFIKCKIFEFFYFKGSFVT